MSSSSKALTYISYLLLRCESSLGLWRETTDTLRFVSNPTRHPLSLSKEVYDVRIPAVQPTNIVLPRREERSRHRSIPPSLVILLPPPTRGAKSPPKRQDGFRVVVTKPKYLLHINISNDLELTSCNTQPPWSYIEISGDKGGRTIQEGGGVTVVP